MKASDWEKSLEERPRRTILKGLLSAVAIIAVVTAAGWGIKMIFYPAQQAGRVLTKTFDADNMIYNYEWFKRQRQDVIAIDVKITAATETMKAFETSVGSRENWKFDDRGEWNRINAILLGLKGQRAAMVAEYNARSEMANRSIFRTGDLPETLN